jgi:UDP-N-acetylglucosamine 2-epimerase (hydrolysing)
MPKKLEPKSKASRDLLFVTGTRADYGKLEPLALAAVNAGHQVTFFVTGMHMLEKYGLTKEEVHRNKQFSVVEFVNQRESDPQDIILAKTVVGFSDYLQEHRPELVVIHGDRVEALACSIVCATNYVRCAHVEGGEVSGTIDEQFRHCNSKLSAVHLVSSCEAKRRVERLGEPTESIHVIGSPELDIHSRPSGVSLDEVRRRYDIASDDYGVCVFHPVTSEASNMREQAEALFEALIASSRYYVVILPNNDPGSDSILSIIRELPKSQFRVLPSMRFNYFSELIRNARVIVGNSSMGVREAPFIGVPSLDIGTRQSNRGAAPSLFHCAANDRAKIEGFISNNWFKRFPGSKGFGNGDSARSFISLLSRSDFWERSLQKYFVE